jgi:DNA-binding transcriptional regulator YhcF (GntR family)
MQKTPSEKLSLWVEEQLRARKPGYRFPSDSELAASFSVSPRTVERLLKKYRQSGQLLRIRGKGTFMPGGAELKERAPQEAKSSSEAIVDVMRDAICSGSLMRGDSLPQVKYISRKFKTSAATVSRAYRQLESMGYVAKVGKTFWVGAFDTIVRQKPHMDVYLFKYDSLDFSDIFTTDMLAPAYRKMERELTGSGYILRFESTANLSHILQRYVRERRAPYGIILYKIRPEAFLELYPGIKSFYETMRNTRDIRLPVLLDWELGGIFERIPRRVQIFSRGHISTSTAKAIGRYLVGSKYSHATFFIDLTRRFWYIPAESAMLKAWLETRNLNRSIQLGFVVLDKDCTQTGKEYADEFSVRQKPHIERNILKYDDVSYDDFAHSVSVCQSIEQALKQNRSSNLWLFSNAEHAAIAFEYCERNSKKIPHDIAIISLENDPCCYHRGISYCDVDWDKIGYQMAHIITGTLSVAKTTKGFIRTEARVVERLTTR